METLLSEADRLKQENNRLARLVLSPFLRDTGNRADGSNGSARDLSTMMCARTLAERAALLDLEVTVKAAEVVIQLGATSLADEIHHDTSADAPGEPQEEPVIAIALAEGADVIIKFAENKTTRPTYFNPNDSPDHAKIVHDTLLLLTYDRCKIGEKAMKTYEDEVSVLLNRYSSPHSLSDFELAIVARSPEFAADPEELSIHDQAVSIVAWHVDSLLSVFPADEPIDPKAIMTQVVRSIWPFQQTPE